MNHFIVIASMLSGVLACAIEPTGPKEVVGTSLTRPVPMQITGNRAVIIAKNIATNLPSTVGTKSPQPAVPWLTLDGTRDVAQMKTALESNPDHFKVSVVEPENPEIVSKAIRDSALMTSPNGTLVLLFAGFANERGELTLADGGRFTFGNILAATGSLGNRVPRFNRLVTIVAASLDASWVEETAAMDRAKNFADSVIVTSLPRLSVEGTDHDETTLSLLHPAGSRLLVTLRDAIAAKRPPKDAVQASGILSAIKLMQENHELHYGPGPVVRTGANSRQKS